MDRLLVDADIIVADILNLSTGEPAKEIEALGKEKEGMAKEKIPYLAKRFFNAKIPSKVPKRKHLIIVNLTSMKTWTTMLL